jgi:hypothetical protein
MPRFARSEVETAFAHYWKVGCVDEDWAAWTSLFVPDVRYVDYFWGPLRGRAEVGLWIDAVMKGVPEIYTVLDWYMIDDDKVVWSMQNRRDNPDPAGPPYLDFAGLSVAKYAGDGRWSYEEDYWDVKAARETAQLYAAACQKMGTSFEQRLTRKYWPAGPSWARLESGVAPKPAWLGMRDVQPITKPRELRDILAGLHR